MGPWAPFPFPGGSGIHTSHHEDNIQHYEPAHLSNNPPEAKATALVDRWMCVRRWTGLSNRTGLHWTASPPRRDSKVTRFSSPGPGNLNSIRFSDSLPPWPQAIQLKVALIGCGSCATLFGTAPPHRLECKPVQGQCNDNYELPDARFEIKTATHK